MKKIFTYLAASLFSLFSLEIANKKKFAKVSDQPRWIIDLVPDIPESYARSERTSRIINALGFKGPFRATKHQYVLIGRHKNIYPKPS